MSLHNPAYFFQQSDYTAFDKSRWADDSPEAVADRVAVRDKLIRLNERILPRLHERGFNLHPHYEEAYLTSKVEHKAEGSLFNSPNISEIWLHYGRDKEASRALRGKVPDGHDSPVYQMRIQVTVQSESLGIWLRVGMPGGGLWEKEKLRAGWRNDPVLLERLWEEVNSLPEYHLWIKPGTVFNFIEIYDRPMLKDMLKAVQPHEYALISRNYPMNDDALREIVIEDTLIREIERLYKLYTVLLSH